MPPVFLKGATWPFAFKNAKTDPDSYSGPGHSLLYSDPRCKSLGTVKWVVELDSEGSPYPLGPPPYADDNLSAYAEVSMEAAQEIWAIDGQLRQEAARRGANVVHYQKRYWTKLTEVENRWEHTNTTVDRDTRTGDVTWTHYYRSVLASNEYIAYAGNAALFACDPAVSLARSCRDEREAQMGAEALPEYIAEGGFAPQARILMAHSPMVWASLQQFCNGSCEKGIPPEVAEQWIESGNWCGSLERASLDPSEIL